MRLGLDTNVLIYAHVPAFPRHEGVRAYLQAELRRLETVLVVTPMILHEFVHIVTDARRFEPPLAMSEALAVARLYLGRTNVECVPVDEDSCLLMIELLDRHQLGRNRIADTLLAATLLTHGVTDLVTCNKEDFRHFEDLHVVDPIEAG